MAAGALEQQASQSTLLTAMSGPLSAAWASLLSVNDLEASLPKYVAGVQSVVQQFGRTSASLAASYYARERAAAGIRGTFTVRPVPPSSSLDVVEKGIRWATKGLWSETPDIETAKELAAATAERYVLDAGRSTIIDAVKADRKSKGWARVVEPGACSFCLLLATRGAVYRTDTTASFKAHDHCRCHVEPVFNAYEPTAQIRQAQATYQSVKKSTRGGSAAVRRAFRQAIESQSSTQQPHGG